MERDAPGLERRAIHATQLDSFTLEVDANLLTPALAAIGGGRCPVLPAVVIEDAEAIEEDVLERVVVGPLLGFGDHAGDLRWGENGHQNTGWP